MIPKKLELRNFLSYGDTPTSVDFNGMHLACLSGENGNGKSALLDAITWALWGEARGSADELIRLGADEMRVVFDFELNDNQYQVIKGRNRRNSASEWNLFVLDDLGNKKSITGQGIRDTAAKIQHLLRMDFKTFVNSAYIQQGRADEFTKQSVGDRKKILAEILDLSRYDILEQKAKDKRNEADRKIVQTDQMISANMNELKNEELWKQQLSEANVELSGYEQQIKELDEVNHRLNARLLELKADAEKLKIAANRIKNLESEISSYEAEKKDQEMKMIAAKEMIDKKDSIITGDEKRKKAIEEYDLLNEKLQQLRSIEHNIAQIKLTIDGEKRRLEMERQNLKKQIDEINEKLSISEKLKSEIEPLKVKASEIDVLDEKLLKLREDHSKYIDEFSRLKNQFESADEKKKDLESKRELLNEPGAKCPVCLTELDEDRHQSIIEDYDRQISEIVKLIKDFKMQGTEAKTNRDKTKKEIDDIESEIKTGESIKYKITVAETKIAEYEKSADKKQAIIESINKTDDMLSSEKYAEKQRDELCKLEEEIKKLNYNQARHQNINSELQTLRAFESLMLKLKNAEENIISYEKNLSMITDSIEIRRKQIDENKQIIDELKSIDAELKSEQAKIEKTSAELKTLRESEKIAIGRKATLVNSLERCVKLKTETDNYREELKNAKKDKSIYTDLMAAFGKKGVQALIIENAIPEIQDEANQLLARMTDNSMQINIDTIKDKKTGGIAETLDIKISDDMGIRPYELYSGGEAFRVNFALRIALSRLLARRAGAKLQTLIIDEGFGTQDGKGREKLIEAIDSIKDDFELILVISHIDELKDAFPTRIEITKDDNGSQISVN